MEFGRGPFQLVPSGAGVALFPEAWWWFLWGVLIVPLSMLGLGALEWDGGGGAPLALVLFFVGGSRRVLFAAAFVFPLWSSRVSDWRGRRLHFIGIGGAGMSGLALVARSLGASVTGSDRADSSYVERVRAAGVEVSIGHAAGAVPAGAEVVVSTAISESN